MRLASASFVVAFSILAPASPVQARPGESTTVEFPQAYGSAVAFARADGFDFADGQLESLSFLRSEDSAFLDRQPDSDYMSRFREPLKGREYWLACFGPKTPALGGVSCYAMERGSLRLLSAYRAR